MRSSKWLWACVAVVGAGIAAIPCFHELAVKAPAVKPPISRQHFADDYMAAAQRLVRDDRFEYQARDFSIKVTNPDGTQWTAFLGNAYAVVLAHPQDEAKILERFIVSMAPKGLPGVLSHADRLAVLSVIKTEAWVTWAKSTIA